MIGIFFKKVGIVYIKKKQYFCPVFYYYIVNKQ